ncbi:MAG: MarR family transcriptional regulator [bacterium]|nr:MarR family transcriptional regulator [bacterium]
MATENEMVIKEIVGAIRRLVRVVYLDTSKISRQFGLTGSQNMVLRSLIHNGSLSSADLSRKLYVTPSNITGVIDRLEKKGLVERVKKVGDRRVALITLTDTGTELSKSLPDPIEKRFISELAHLEPEHVQILAMAMNQILNLVDAKGVEEVPLDLSHEYAPGPLDDMYK